MANSYWDLSREEPDTPPRWTMPALCILNRQVNMDEVQWGFPGAGVHILEGSRQAVQWERHEEVNPIPWNFISDGWP